MNDRKIHFKATLEDGTVITSKTSYYFGIDPLGVYVEEKKGRNYNVKQWTEFTDANGTDVYDGDIIEFTVNGFKMKDQVIFHNGQYMTKNNIVPLKDIFKPNSKVFVCD